MIILRSCTKLFWKIKGELFKLFVIDIRNYANTFYWAVLRTDNTFYKKNNWAEFNLVLHEIDRHW